MEIHNWHDAPQGDKYVAEFSIYFEQFGWWIHKCRLWNTQRQGRYISFYSYSTEDELGKKNWHPISHPDKRRAAEFQKKCLEVIEPFLKLADRSV